MNGFKAGRRRRIPTETQGVSAREAGIAAGLRQECSGGNGGLASGLVSARGGRQPM
jgi:hypothetical protein